MRRTKFDGSFFICFLINILLNLEGAIPGVILLVLHFLISISVWWSIGAFALWIIYLFIWMIILRWASSCSSANNIEKENKNPYSKVRYNNSIKGNTDE